MKKKYSFDWDFLRSANIGRERLGEEMPVTIYRLMQYTVIEALEENLGTEWAEDVMRQAGVKAGLRFSENLLDLTLEPGPFLSHLQKKLKDLKIAILRVEKMDEHRLEFIVSVDEDLECSGLPVQGGSVCFYAEGFLAGILENYSGKKFWVRETDCWDAEGRTCRFNARPQVKAVQLSTV